MSGPDVWGPHGWKFIHYITLGYPNNPTPLDKSQYYNFFESLNPLIECSLGKITAQAITGPASGPRPTSSTPAINSILILFPNERTYFVHLFV